MQLGVVWHGVKQEPEQTPIAVQTFEPSSHFIVFLAGHT
jgi:hypothetical protein